MEIGPIEILMIFITIFIALGASFILPEKKAIMKGEVPKYSSGKRNAVYLLGSLVLVITIIYLLTTIINSGSINLLAALNGLFFSLMGVGLVLVNRSIVATMKDRSMDGMLFGSSQSMAATIPVDVVSSGVQQQVQSPSGDSGDIRVHVRKPVDPTQSQPSTPAGQSMRVGCPKCNGVITIDRSQPVSKIQCPMCGFEGNLG